MTLVESARYPNHTVEIDGPLHDAARATLRPLDHTAGSRTLGHYSVFAQAAAIAPAANAQLAALRTTDPSTVVVLLRAYVCVTVATAVTAQRTDPIVLNVARGYTARDATNATAVVVAANAQKARTIMGVSIVGSAGNIDVASAAAGLTGGTKTADTSAHGAAAFGAGGAVAGLGTGMPVTDLYSAINSIRHPIVLGPQEGVIVNWGPTALATGTVVVGVGFEWAELASY